MTPWRSWYPPVKRLLDVVLALLLLGPTLALLAVLAVASFLFQGRRIFFSQVRIGRYGKSFRMVKLRTMTGAPGEGRAFREKDRITRYGRVIRRSRLDELPQVLHVLAGQMSFVGPRPLLATHLWEVGGGGRRHEVRPGITGYAQIELAETGYLDKHDQITLDEQYVENIGLRTDLRIIGRTLLTILWVPSGSCRATAGGAGAPAGGPARAAPGHGGGRPATPLEGATHTSP